MNKYDKPIGSNPLPFEVQQKLGEFLDWVDTKYTFKNGSTAMFWYLSSIIEDQIESKKDG